MNPKMEKLLEGLKDGPPEYERGAKLDERSAHKLHVCDDEHYDGRMCQFCDGGLSACTVCGGFEGSLTTMCPGMPLTVDQLDAVYAKLIDFNNFQWWVPALGETEFRVYAIWRQSNGY